MSGPAAAGPRPPSVFLGMTEIAGYYGGLKRGFDELGVRAFFLDQGDHPFVYGGASDNTLVRLGRLVNRTRVRAVRRSSPTRAAWAAADRIVRGLTLLWAAAAFEVFIFGFATSFFDLRELRWLRRVGKKLIFVFQGSAARPPYLDGSYVGPDGEPPEAGLLVRLAAEKKRRIARIERWAHQIVSDPLSAHFHERRFVPFLGLGLPHAAAGPSPPAPRPAAGRPVRILHSPSHPHVKGSARIRATVEALEHRGVPLDYVEIRDQPNSVVLDELQRCDFVIDQLYSDFPLAGFATEAAHAGKPAVVGGYGWGEAVHPPEHLPPAERCHPDRLEPAIERLATDERHRLALGQAAARFVRSEWTCRKMAERYLRIIEGRFAEHEMFDPRQVRYTHGCGLSEARVKEQIEATVETGGVAALQLGDKPELERRLLELACLTSAHRA